jgi:2-keto-4-pentenoate hydratase
MSVLADVLRELAGLFVDDGALALAIVAVVALAGAMAALGFSSAAGAILLFGSLGVLLANTVRAGRR